MKNKLMLFLVFIIYGLGSSLVNAEEKQQSFGFEKNNAAYEFVSGVVEENVLYMSANTLDQAAPILVITKPEVHAAAYAVTGEIKYANVRDAGHLELWNTFPNGQSFFTKGLASNGLDSVIEGDSNWRKFALRFFRNGNARFDVSEVPPPSELRLNAYLPSGGEIWLKGISLVNLESQSDWAALTGAWWSERRAGLVFGVLGGVLGFVGAGIGIAASKNKAKKFLLIFIQILAVIGIVLLATGVVAFTQAQPYHVYYPLGLTGFIVVLVFSFSYFILKKRFTAMELHKMKAMDA